MGQVHFRGEAYKATVAANDTGLGALMWRVELPPTPASTSPGNITVTGLGATLTLANVLFGDVWMCGGVPAAPPAESPTSPRCSRLTLPHGIMGLCLWRAGQSNMEVPLDETFEWFHRDVSNDTDYPIRTMVFPHVQGLNESTIHVNDDRPIPWLEANYDTLSTFSSVCYYFGKALHKRMAADGEVVPMGLVKNCWGGSLIEA